MQNQSLVSLMNMLMAQQAALSTQLQTASDPAVAGAISTEIYELLHRIILTQNLLFQSDTDQLKSALVTVKSADGTLTAAIGKIQKSADVISAVSTYLGYVDKAIDLAKTVGLA